MRCLKGNALLDVSARQMVDTASGHWRKGLEGGWGSHKIVIKASPRLDNVHNMTDRMKK